MTKINVSELEGAALDWAVGVAVKGFDSVIFEKDGSKYVSALCYYEKTDSDHWMGWMPSTQWSQGGPLIDQLSAAIDSPRQTNKDRWQAQCWDEYSFQAGPTPLIAAMRSIVAAEIGDTIDVPEELLC